MDRLTKTPRKQLDWVAKYDKEKMSQIGIKISKPERAVYEK